MFLSNASIRRPVAMVCLILALVLIGVNSYRKIGLELMPSFDVPYITVVTVYPGANPTEIETDVAKRIEDAVVTLDGLKHVTSVCMENVCQTLLEFELAIDVDVAANDVREKLDLILSDFPEGVEQPTVLKFDVNAQPIINLALTGDVPLDELYDYADNTLRDRLATLEGVADVELRGGAEREVHLLLDRGKLAARGLTSMDVVQAIQKNVRTIPSGRVRDGGTEYTVKFDAEYKTIQDIGSLEVANLHGARVYVNDVGRVELASDELRQRAYIDGKPCIGVQVVKKADANAVSVMNRVQSAMDGLSAMLPGGMELVWVSDSGTFVQSTVDSATGDIVQGVLLTAAILFLFLYNIRTTFIVAVTMPLTIVISLPFLHLLGYTLNTSTLLALGISVGILVTNSIVVLESITKRFAAGMPPREAARLGASEVGIAVVASAGTNLVVLIPIAFMGGIMGRFFQPFAVTTIIVTVASLFISFTLTPILCSQLLKHSKPNGFLVRIEAVWNRMFDAVARRYAGALRFFAGRRWAAIGVLAFSVLLLVHAVRLAGGLGMTFVDEVDSAVLYVKLEFPTRYGLALTTDRVQEIESRLKDLPGLKHRLTTIGKVEGIIGQSSEGVYLAQVLLKFVEKTERKETSQELVDLARARVGNVPECIVTVGKQTLVGGASIPIEMEIAGDDLATLDRLALETKQRVEVLDGIQDPDTSVRVGKPEIRVRPRRAVLAELNMPATALGYALRGNLEGIKAGVFKEGARSYDIRVKFQEEEGKDQVSRFQFPGMPGNAVVLANFADIDEGVSPVQITRADKRRVSKLYSNLRSDKPLGTAVNEVTRILKDDVQLPPGYDYRFIGVYEMMEEAGAAFLEAGLLAVVLTFLTLAAVLESFRQPFIILVTIPLGVIGVIWGLYLANQSISVFVLLGGVMLVGIVVNNAILILDRVNQLVAQGTSYREAMLEAAAEEFRPVIMITLAAILGMMPLAFGHGLGSELRTGIGIASIGGIAVSAVLTLVVIPVLYDLFTREGSTRKPS